VSARWITHRFFVQGDPPTGLVRELEDAGWADIVVDEEVSGDGYWHVAASRVEAADGRSDERELRTLARRYGATYNGSDPTVYSDGTYPRADGPLS
jgi:alkylation response protein AidB-like acyl-CoA dehydrogenase